ncbi:tetratricopeptide repeat protein [Aureitalea sp. L0-47]|uniref:tetratricopeptide repeat-containing sensor histidine kinase n=1 Tax=Aureitalea sp. L0-47 TaxID=2816962 RepID=UPI0022378373|nr:histidine kinase [Aureitalea sp. L0-47]MCW5520938.1 tetratricopeptide repeat protein [Aureitalea sp. L0-47]
MLTIILICTFIAQSLGQSNQLEDSLKVVLSQTTNDSIRMTLYNELRKATYYNEPEVSKNYTQEYLKVAERNRDSFHIALCSYYLGNADLTLGNYQEALPNYLKAANYFENSDDPGRLSSVYNGIAAAYEKHGIDSLSLMYFTKSYEISEEQEDGKRMGIALNNISNIYRNRGDLVTAIEYLERSREILSEPAFAKYYIPISINLANGYSDYERPQKAKEIFLNTLPRIDTTADIFHYATLLRGLGGVYTQEGDKRRGLRYYERAYDAFRAHGFADEKLETMPFLIDAYYENDQTRKGMNLFYEYSEAKDSIFNSEKEKSLTEALQKYEAEKKDKALLEQALTIEKNARQKNRILFGLISAIMFAIILYFFFRKRLQYQKTIAEQNASLQLQKITELQQKNKLLALSSMIEGQEAERLRIAKDLHDSLGGLLSSVKAHFVSIQKEIQQLAKLNLTERTNELIDEACIEVRRISHNMMPHALSISGLKGAVEDMAENLREEGYKVTLEMSDLPEIENTKKVMIYRLMQEVISNIRKHANAKTILLQLLPYDNKLNLIIEDNGDGFDYVKALEKDGLGIKSINSRAEFLDGNIEWDSKPGDGTSISINIPL